MKALTLFFMVFSFVVSGCSQLSSISSTQHQQLNQLLEGHHYQAALQLINNSTPEHAEHLLLQSQRADVIDQQSLYIAHIIKKSQRLTQQKKWPQATQLLESNLAKNNANQSLQQALVILQKKRQYFIHQQQLLLAEHNAKTLPTTLSITRQLLLAEPNNNELLTLQQKTNEQIELAATLLAQQVHTHINKQQWGQARRYLKAHQQLKGSNGLKKSRLVLSRQQQKTLHQQQRKNQHDNQQRLKEQQLALQQALNDKDWLRVHELQASLQNSRQQQPAIDQLLNKVTLNMQQLSREQVQQGQRHYAQGRIDQAINSWQLALKISPNDNDLRERLQRAIRFQTNIKKLQ